MKSLITAAMMALAMTAYAVSYTVPGDADPWLATGIIDNIGTPEPPDTAPDQSPVLVGAVSTGDTIFWNAYGEVGHPGEVSGPNGAGDTSRNIGGYNGIPDLTAPICSLIGVFTFGPDSGQAFFMGDNGSTVVPAGAVDFFLGTMDSYGWANNIGQFEVDITIRSSSVPDAGSSIALVGLACTMLGALGRKVRQ
jgi:hypothetical protein